jgi:hypothetical protein
VFMDSEMPLMKDLGNALFPSSEGYAPKHWFLNIPITYLDKMTAILLWQEVKMTKFHQQLLRILLHILKKKKNEVFYTRRSTLLVKRNLKNAYDSILFF